MRPFCFYRKTDKVVLRSDCADAQADLELYCPHIFQDPFSHDAEKMKYLYDVFLYFQNIEEPNTKGSQKRTKERINKFRMVFRDKDG